MFAYRPHVEHMFFLSKEFKVAGHKVFHFNCKSSVPNCYTLELRNSSKLKECSKCILGSLYSYTNENTTFIDPNLKTEKDLIQLTQSSSYTLTRIENPEDKNLPDVIEIQKRLLDSVQIAYENTKEWIIKNQLDYVLFFNGRMDITAAIKQACEDLNIKFTAVERTWFGDGIQFNPGQNCLSLNALHELSREYISKPLTKHQISTAASHITTRFRTGVNLEWRNYNKDAQDIEWPAGRTGLKILILPSSKNEQLGQHDWRNEWDDYTSIFEKVISKFSGKFNNCIVRGHPNWSENIGKVKGTRISDYYEDWCTKKDVHFLPGHTKANTTNLIAQADLVILNGSSAVYEAALLGTPTISVGRCQYQFGNFSKMVLSDSELNDLNPNDILNQDPKETIRMALRFIYIFGIRYAIFNNVIKAKTTTKFEYHDHIDTDRILKIIDTNKLIPDDTDFSLNEEEEDEIIQLVLEKSWDKLEYNPETLNKKKLKIERRGVFKTVDKIRDFFPRGDF